VAVDDKEEKKNQSNLPYRRPYPTVHITRNFRKFESTRTRVVVRLYVVFTLRYTIF
jgi:hypothetical protein